MSVTESFTTVAGSQFVLKCNVAVADYLKDVETIIVVRLRDPAGELVDDGLGGNLLYEPERPLSTSDSGLYTCLSSIFDASDNPLGNGNSTMNLTVFPIGTYLCHLASLVFKPFISPVPEPKVVISVNTTDPLLPEDSLTLTCLVIIPQNRDIDAVQSIVSTWSGPDRIVPGDRDTVTPLSQCGQGMYISFLSTSGLVESEDSGEFVCSVQVSGVENTLHNATNSDTISIKFGEYVQ